MAVLQTGFGLALTLAGWLIARAVAGAWRFRPVEVLHDLVAPLGTFAVLLAATGRPLFAGIFSFATYAGFAFADKVKRAVLDEPIIFSDMSEIFELFRHPDLYLPFAGTSKVLVGAAAAAVFFALAFWFEPPIFSATLLQATASFAVALGVIALMVLLVGPWARLLRGFAPSGDLAQDARRFGPFAVLGVYGIIARDERRARQAAVAPVKAAAGMHEKNQPPVILVQSESFFDARRLYPALPATFLRAFATACQASVQWGLLSVPCWGANTTRTEFAAITGLPESAIGFDRFNPYHAFARTKLTSLAWSLKAKGYHTVCVHPFDRTFYGRDRVMPQLGFDDFVGEEAFSDADRIHGYVSDAAVAALCTRLLSQYPDRPVFLFVITMQNHGPWNTLQEPQPMMPPGLDRVAQAEGLGQYLRGLNDADAMISLLTQALIQDGRNGLLSFYGDHLPGFPLTFKATDFLANETDYFLWRPGQVSAQRQDISAHDLPAAILAALQNHDIPQPL